jgi:hypothetical protein
MNHAPEAIYFALMLFAVHVAAYYAAKAHKANGKAGDLATDLLEEQQKCKEMTYEADYWRGLVAWKESHADRDPTTEELDAMWLDVTTRKPFTPWAFTAAAPLQTKDGRATWSTLASLTATKGEHQ